MLLLSLLLACGIDDPDGGDGPDPVACECDPGDTAAGSDTATGGDSGTTATDSGCVDTDTADTTDPCADSGTTGR